MYLPNVSFHAPESLAEVGELLTRLGPDAALLAGGTDLLVDLKVGRRAAGHLVSIHRIATLRGVSESAEGLRIGALATISELDRHPFVQSRLAGIRDATSRLAAPQIRNMATVGGNLACAVPCADLPPILITLRASVLIWSPAGERRLPMEEFVLNVRKTALQTGEVLSAVLVPHPPERFGAAYARLSLREGNAIAVAGVAASLQLDAGGRIAAARVALGAVAPISKLVSGAREALEGRAPGSDAFAQAARQAAEAAEPICDLRGTAEYRRTAVEVLARRALQSALERARESRS